MTDEQIEYRARLHEIYARLKRLTLEFEIIYNDFEIKKKLQSVQEVYMHTIIINLWMILGTGRNDKFRLCKAKLLFSEKTIHDKADKIIKEHANLISKLGKNRNRISTHLDSRLVELKFSDDFVKEHEKQCEISAPGMMANDRANERYTPMDMKNDLPEINQILEDVKEILVLIRKESVL